MLSTDRLCPGCMKDNGGEPICSLCGWDSSKNNAPDKLPVRFVIRDRYIIGKTIFSDTESTVYLGFDTIENKPVSIKEYFPAGLVKRNPDKTVFVPREALFAFNDGLIEFIETNKRFIGFPLASLPSTYSVFEENSTAYSICEAVFGITLKSFFEQSGGILKWEQVRPLLLPLIDSLKAINDMGFIHGEISPDSILVCRDNKLRFISVSIKAVKSTKKPDENNPAVFTPFITDGYSALEQYSEAYGQIGAYTDVYGICATLLTALTGIVPPPAGERLHGDTLRIPAHFADELPRQVLVSIANGMQVKPSERTSNVETLKNELIYGETKENIRKSQRAAKAAAAATAVQNQPQKKGSGLKYAAITAVITVVVFIIAGAFVYFKYLRKDDDADTGSKASNQPQVVDNSGDNGETTEPEVKKELFVVPDFTGRSYYDVINASDYKKFNLVLKCKVYDSSTPRGEICEQSIAKGEEVERGTTVELTVSLGSFEVKSIDTIIGKTEQEAIIELLKAGFAYENITVKDYSANDKPYGTVIMYEIDPALKANQKLNVEMKVKIYVNRANAATTQNSEEKEDN